MSSELKELWRWRVAVALILGLYASMFAYHQGKHNSDRWYAEHQSIRWVSTGGFIGVLTMRGGNAVLETIGDINGKRTLVLRDGQSCRIHSTDGVKYEASCQEVIGTR